VQQTLSRLDTHPPARPTRGQSPIPKILSHATNFDPGALTILTVYVVWYSLLIWRGHGIPYVMDNNETFSALNHARNLWSFDFFRSFGLTDEAVSPDAAAHPFVHTHQGNFPRLFAFLLYAAGARSVESQVWITAMTIGTASILMGYTFFRRVAGSLFATVTMLLLMTDYLMFAQWQVNTYRVWEGFLFFSAFNCIHGLLEWKRGRWATATISTYAALFYGELVFAAFVAFTVGFYTVWTYRRTPGLIMLGGLVQGTGAALSLITLIIQLALYLGWQDFQTDLHLTLTSRNYAPDSTDFISTLRQFYESRNIVFFYNMQSDAQFAGVLASARLLFRYVLQIPTPFLSLLGLGTAAAALLSDSKPAGPRNIAALTPAASIASVVLLVPSCFVFILAIIGDGAALGQPYAGIGCCANLVPWIVLACFLLATVIAVALPIYVRVVAISGTPPDIYRCLKASVFLLCFGLLILGQGELYDRGAALLWWKALSPFPPWGAKIFVCATAFMGSLVILTGRLGMLGRWHKTPSSLFPFFACGALGYLIVYKLSSGYIFSGYLVRLCPFLVFHVDALIALGLFVVIAVTVTLFSRTDFFSALTKGACAASAIASLAFAGDWIFVQLRYFEIFPPDQLDFIRILRDPQLRGRGLISNNYSTPFGYVANSWAYILPNPAALNGTSPQNKIDYLWLADRSTNNSYLTPQFYVCFESRSALDALLSELSAPSSNQSGCSHLPIVQRALSGNAEGGLPKAAVVARDPADDHWAILQLEWSTSSDR
jgi:hypothetical protein